jgi:GWxTD domain-containing protein
MRARTGRIACALLLFLGTGLIAPVCAETLGELFARVKAKVAARAYADGLAALSELDAEAQKPENERARAALRPAAAFYRGVCLAGIGKADEAKEAFAVFIAANPDKDIDRKAYGGSVVAAFEQARKSRSGGGIDEETAPAITLAYRSTALLTESSALPGPDWANGPVKYLLSSGESRAYSRLSDQISRAEFVARFWRARDPVSDTPENEFRREFEHRVAFADENFSEGSTRGSLTDRGMVFVLLGPPTGVVRRPISTTEDTPVVLPGRIPTPRSIKPPTDMPSSWKEIWRYSREVLPPEVPERHVDVTFVTRTDYGRNLFQRDGPSLRALEAARPRPRATD